MAWNAPHDVESTRPGGRQRRRNTGTSRASLHDIEEDYAWETQRNAGEHRPSEPITKENMVHAVEEQRQVIENTYANALKAVNIAGALAFIVAVTIALLIISNIVWYFYFINVNDTANQNEEDLLVLNDTLNSIAGSISVVNHNLLFGLAVDSHTQYALETGRPTTEFLAHAADGTIHFTEGTIDLVSLGAGVPITPGDRDVKSLVEGDGISISSTGTEITITSNVSIIVDEVLLDLNLTSVGNGVPLVPGGTDVKSVLGGFGINVSCPNNTLIIDSTVFLIPIGNGTALTPGDLDVKGLGSDESILITSTIDTVNLAINTTFLETVLSLNDISTGEAITPGGVDVKGIVGGAGINVTSTGTDVVVSLEDAAPPVLNDVSTGFSLTPGGLSLKGIVALEGIDIFTNATDVVIGLEADAVILNSIGTGEILAPSGLDVRTLLGGDGISLSGAANEITIINAHTLTTNQVTVNRTIASTEALLSANATTGIISADGNSTIEDVSADCAIGLFAMGCGCDRLLNSGPSGLVMLKSHLIDRSGGNETCVCEYDFAQTAGASYTIFAQVTCLSLG